MPQTMIDKALVRVNNEQWKVVQAHFSARFKETLVRQPWDRAPLVGHMSREMRPEEELWYEAFVLGWACFSNETAYAQKAMQAAKPRTKN